MDIIPEITEILGEENVFTDPVECLSYSRDLSVHEGVPDAVVFGQTSEQIAAVMRLANRARVPVTVQGSGTATTGASLPVEGGILLDIDGGVDVVRSSAQAAEHGLCIARIARLAQSLSIQGDDGIAGDDEMVGMGE